MACLCPVVAARIPGLEETCGDAAVYCDPHSPADIATQVLGLLDDPALDRVMRERAGARAAGFTWERAARQLAHIADRFAAGRRV
jgi:glycosyltransferase involved in cell wall biosynthesis